MKRKVVADQNLSTVEASHITFDSWVGVLFGGNQRLILQTFSYEQDDQSERVYEHHLVSFRNLVKGYFTHRQMVNIQSLRNLVHNDSYELFVFDSETELLDWLVEKNS